MVQKSIKSLNVSIDTSSALPVYEQVKRGIKMLVYSGYLQEGDQLVPIRELAANLKVNPNTIVKVYYQLDQEGLIYSQHGSGYFVRMGFGASTRQKEDLFAKITDEYVYKGLQLGFSVETMVKILTERWKAKTEGG
jgi:GntR family transcriptional regulator